MEMLGSLMFCFSFAGSPFPAMIVKGKAISCDDTECQAILGNAYQCVNMRSVQQRSLILKLLCTQIVAF